MQADFANSKICVSESLTETKFMDVASVFIFSCLCVINDSKRQVLESDDCGRNPLVLVCFEALQSSFFAI